MHYLNRILKTTLMSHYRFIRFNHNEQNQKFILSSKIIAHLFLGSVVFLERNVHWNECGDFVASFIKINLDLKKEKYHLYLTSKSAYNLHIVLSHQAILFFYIQILGTEGDARMNAILHLRNQCQIHCCDILTYSELDSYLLFLNAKQSSHQLQTTGFLQWENASLSRK